MGTRLCVAEHPDVWAEVAGDAAKRIICQRHFYIQISRGQGMGRKFLCCSDLVARKRQWQ